MKRRNQVFSTILAVALAMNMTVMPVYADESATSDSNISTTENVGANDSSDVQSDVSDALDDNTNDNSSSQVDGEEDIDNKVDNGGSSDGEDANDSVRDDTTADAQTEDDTIDVDTEATDDAVESDNSGIMLLADEQEEYKYVTMNIPYKVLYSNKELAEDVPDVISTATQNKYTQSTGLAKGTYHDETGIRGVLYPVRIKSSDLDAVKQLENANGDYAIVEELTDEPSVYLDINDITDATISGTLNSDSKSGIEITNFTSYTNYGNYQFELTGVNSDETIYGIILTSADGKNYPMYMLNNLWLGGGYKIAWSVEGEPKTLMKDKVSYHHQCSMERSSVTKVTVLTSAGTYDISCDLEMKQHYTGEVSATASTDTLIEVSGLPESINNAKVKVYYNASSDRRNPNYIYLADGKDIVDGSISLDTAMDTEHEYTVYIESDNYADIVVERLKLNVSNQEPSVQEPDVEPTPSTGSSSSESSSSSSDDEEDTPTPTETTQLVSVEPSITTADGTVVTGWNNVIETAFNNAILLATNTTQNRDSELYQYGSVSPSATHVTVDINLANVTNLEIPKTAVETMKQSGADYNFYYKNIAITIPSTSLSNWEGSIDLNLEIENKNFNADFDVFSLKKDKDTPIAAGTIINAVLSPAKAGKVAYVFNNSENGGYELAEAVQISEIGTIMLAIDGIDEFLILY